VFTTITVCDYSHLSPPSHRKTSLIYFTVVVILKHPFDQIYMISFQKELKIVDSIIIIYYVKCKQVIFLSWEVESSRTQTTFTWNCLFNGNALSEFDIAISHDWFSIGGFLQRPRKVVIYLAKHQRRVITTLSVKQIYHNQKSAKVFIKVACASMQTNTEVSNNKTHTHTHTLQMKNLQTGTLKKEGGEQRNKQTNKQEQRR